MRIISKFTTKWCTCKNRMDGKTVLLTGATSGIGYEAALDLARRGARLILPVRNMEKGKTVSSTISRLTGNKNINLKFMDLANLDSVREFCQSLVAEEARIDVLINNAGNAPWEKVIDITDDGLEYQMASNYFGHFLMTNLIIDLMKNAAPSRIINMGSKVHWRSTDLDMDNLNFQRGDAGYWKIYGASKLCMMLFTKELSRKLEDDGVVVNTMHPGVVDTPIYDRQPTYIRLLLWIPRKILFRSPKEGAQTLIHLAVAPEVQNISGKYFVDCKESSWYSCVVEDTGMAKRLWKKSCELVQLQEKDLRI
ncbi:retinol dehydrogenase 13-like isoform X2 [Artemia franciscana]|nr:hypothetical protein QYM36_012001 [Artemia franciscana]